MQQTIYGETRKDQKVKVSNRKKVENFLELDKLMFDKLKNSKNCLYNNLSIISDQTLNYLNACTDSNESHQLKLLLKKEFDECESIYPFLGDILVDEFFTRSNMSGEKEYFILNSENKEEFLESLKYEEVKLIAEWFMNNASLEYAINVEYSRINDIVVEKIKDLNFNLDYDTSYLGSKNSHTMQDYKFIIIDGQIETIGEVHHLLEKASMTKKPHVIFCFGLSKDVENVIKVNNTQSRFEIFPVVIKFAENTLNVLNDIAVIHNDDIVSANKGQTISQAIRRELNTGRKITFHSNGFNVTPVADESILFSHRLFLLKRINETLVSHNENLLVERMKRFATKKVKIYLPESISKNTTFIRELDYVLRFFKSNNKKMIQFNNKNNKNIYYVPESCIRYISNKIKSLDNTYSELFKMITYK